ncbi:MAG: hypothetical protein ACRDZO_20995 [Egibacteraceae bacterium]
MRIPTPDVRAATTVENRKSRPYQDSDTSTLVEMLELDCDQGRPFNPRVVFELAARALEAEAARRH